MDFTEVRKKFGNNVRTLRVQNNISQEKLAELVGIHRTYIGSIERGERNLSLQNIIRIAQALGVSPKRFFEGIE